MRSANKPKHIKKKTNLVCLLKPTRAKIQGSRPELGPNTIVGVPPCTRSTISGSILHTRQKGIM